MAKYTSRNLNGTANNLSTRNKWGIGLLVFCLVTLFCIITKFIAPIRSFILGVFGLSAYPILIVGAVISVFMMSKKHFVFAKVYIWTLFTLFLTIICLFQLIFATPVGNFSDYLASCYNTKDTAGGLIMGLISYALSAGLNIVGAYILLGLLILICIAFVIDHFLKLNEYNEISARTMTYPVKNTKMKGISDSKNSLDNNINETNVDSEIDLIEKPKKKKANITLNSLQNKEESEDKQEKPSIYAEKLNLLRSKTSNANSSEKDFAINIWGEEFINNLKNKEKPTIEKPKSQDYNLSDLITKKREEDTASVLNLSSSRPTRFVHDEEYNKPTFNTEGTNTNDVVRKTNNFTNNFDRNEQHNINNNINNNQNESRINLNSEEQQTITSDRILHNENKNIEPITRNSRVNQFFESSLNDDEVEEILSPNNGINRKPNFIPNLDERRMNQSNTNLNNQNHHNNRKPEQIKISQTQPTDQPTTKYTKPSPYVKPPLSLLTTESAKSSDNMEDYNKKAAILEETLESFKIPAKVVGITHGPAVTRYELQMPAGIAVKRISQHTDDIAMKMESSHGVRIEAPIPGRNLVGIEIPNGKIATIGLKDIIASQEFTNNKAPLTFALGKDIAGAIKICDLGSMPHLLVAGSTGSGKSVCLNVILLSLLYRLGPEDLKLILIDPKRVEFVTYNYLPHMLIPKAINEGQQALNALDWAIKEMTRRYDLFAEKHVRNFKEYNSLQTVYDGVEPKLPYIVIVIDEVADLMMNSKREMEDKIKRLAQLARAAGMHLILATQRPSVDVITGTIKSNLPSRIAFAVTNYMDSKTILDQGGADKLLGKGDMLYAPQDANEPVRIQCPFVEGTEVCNIVDFIKEHNKSYFDDELNDIVLNGDKKDSNGGLPGESGSNEFDPLLPRALLEFIENGGEASISLIQRRYAVGYGRAARIVDQMERAGYVTPKEGNNKRSVLISKEKYDEIFGTDI